MQRDDTGAAPGPASRLDLPEGLRPAPVGQRQGDGPSAWPRGERALRGLAALAVTVGLRRRPDFDAAPGPRGGYRTYVRCARFVHDATMADPGGRIGHGERVFSRPSVGVLGLTACASGR